jgi:pimeloyl-ACP methyl ester carboxylesterase
MDIDLYAVDKGSGKALVLLHGNGESSDYFEAQIASFARYRRVLAVDTRGHGRSPRGTGPFTLDRFVDDLAAFLARRGIDRADILGFSDGGNIALLFALKYPGRVRTLILNGANLNPLGLKPHVLLPIWLSWLTAVLRATSDEHAVRKKELLSLMARAPHIRPSALCRIDAPALVIAGTNDMIRRRHTEKISRSLKNGRLVILSGSHFIAKENSGEFNAAVYRFLEENNGL